MNKLRWIIFGVICAGMLGGLVFLANKDKKDVSQLDPSKIVASTDTEIGDHVYGNKNSQVVLFEYGDFQCPSCATAFPQIKTIKEKYKSQIAFVFRNFPLTSIHPNALSAATSAEAAGLQGKFWEMHDALYLNQNSWSSASTSDRNTIFAQYASSVGVNAEQYTTELTSTKVADKIARDRAFAKKLDLTGTPSLLINGQKMSDEVVSSVVSGDGSKLTAELDKALKAAGVEPPAKSN